MKRGKFIVIEGNEGVGKTIQSKHLRDRMEDEGFPTVLTQEPSNGPIGKIIRNDYLSGKREISDRRLINYLYAADRLDHIANTEDGMLHLLNQGKNVVTDRYYLSSIGCYAMEFLNTPKYWDELKYIMSLNMTARELLPPDVMIILKCPDEELHNRMDGRQEKIEIYDVDGVRDKIGQAYLDGTQYLRDLGDNIIEIDGVGSTWKVHERIWNAVLPLLGGE